MKFYETDQYGVSAYSGKAEHDGAYWFIYQNDIIYGSVRLIGCTDEAGNIYRWDDNGHDGHYLKIAEVRGDLVVRTEASGLSYYAAETIGKIQEYSGRFCLLETKSAALNTFVGIGYAEGNSALAAGAYLALRRKETHVCSRTYTDEVRKDERVPDIKVPMGITGLISMPLLLNTILGIGGMFFFQIFGGFALGWGQFWDVYWGWYAGLPMVIVSLVGLVTGLVLY